MHTRTRRAAVLLATAAALTACTSASHTDNKPSPTPATSTAEAAPPVTVPPTPSTYAFGTPWAWQSSDGISGKTTAYTYKQPVHSAGSAAEEAGAPGYVWAALEVEVCNDDSSTGPVDVSDSEWTLAYDDGSSVESSSTGYEDFPRPQFPMGGATVKAGRCLRGKIVFPVPGKGRPVRAVYAPAGLDEPVEWDVPGK